MVLKLLPRAEGKQKLLILDEVDGAARRVVAGFWQISAKCCSFSAVSAPIFARKCAFCSIFQNLPDSQAEIFEI